MSRRIVLLVVMVTICTNEAIHWNLTDVRDAVESHSETLRRLEEDLRSRDSVWKWFIDNKGYLEMLMNQKPSEKSEITDYIKKIIVTESQNMNEQVKKAMEYSRSIVDAANKTLDEKEQEFKTYCNRTDSKMNGIVRAQGNGQNILASIEKRLEAVEDVLDDLREGKEVKNSTAEIDIEGSGNADEANLLNSTLPSSSTSPTNLSSLYPIPDYYVT